MFGCPLIYLRLAGRDGEVALRNVLVCVNIFQLYRPTCCPVDTRNSNVWIVGSSGVSSSSDKGEPRSSRPWDTGGGQLKKLGGPFGPQFGLKISGLGPRAPFLDPPLRSSGQRKRKFGYLTPLS